MAPGYLTPICRRGRQPARLCPLCTLPASEPDVRSARPTEVSKRLLGLATVGIVLTGCTTTTTTIPAGTVLVFQIADQGLVSGNGLLVLRGSTALAPVTRHLTPAGVHRVVHGAVDAARCRSCRIGMDELIPAPRSSQGTRRRTSPVVGA